MSEASPHRARQILSDALGKRQISEDEGRILKSWIHAVLDQEIEDGIRLERAERLTVRAADGRRVSQQRYDQIRDEASRLLKETNTLKLMVSQMHEVVARRLATLDDGWRFERWMGDGWSWPTVDQCRQLVGETLAKYRGEVWPK